MCRKNVKGKKLTMEPEDPAKLSFMFARHLITF